MTHVFFYAPHPDDEVLSMSLAILHHIASGYDVHVVSVSRGEITPGSIRIDGALNCSYHGRFHNVAREGIPTDITPEELGLARLAETRSALGVMALIPPSSGLTWGSVNHHDAQLPTNYGKPTGTTAMTGLTCSREGVDLVKPVMQDLITQFPNSLHHTMSPTDNHPDHAACGQALRELKQVTPALANSRFFVSRLYWDYDLNPDVLAQPGKEWYGTGSNSFLSRKTEYDAHLRNHVIQMFACWNPAGRSYAIGYHQVVNQFNNNFGPTASIANLMHA